MLLTIALITALQTAPAADSLPGAWQITGDVAGNPVKALCTIAQEGSKLTGNCASEVSAHPLTGEAKEGKVTFQYEIDYQGQALSVVYSATLASTKDLKEFKGTIEVKPMGAGGTFTATRAPAKP